MDNWRSSGLFLLGLVLTLFYSAFQSSPYFPKDLKLYSSDKKQDLSFTKISGNKATVFYFFLPDCDLSQKYVKTLNEMEKNFRIDDIKFYGIVPGKDYTNAEVNQYAKDYSPVFPILLDPSKKLTSALAASIAPQVVVVNCFGSVLYSGRIDNWAFSPGKTRNFVSEHELLDALDAIRVGRKIKIPNTNAIGCIIE